MTQIESEETERNELIMTSGLQKHLIEYLSSSYLESVSFIWGKVTRVRGVVKGLATDLAIPSDDDYERRSSGNVKVSQAFVNREFEKREKKGLSLLSTVHSQPIISPTHGDIGPVQSWVRVVL